MIKNQTHFSTCFLILLCIALLSQGSAQNLSVCALSGTLPAAGSVKDARETFHIAPHAGKGNFMLRYHTQRNASFHIYDASGRLMFFRILDHDENTLSLKTGLPEGVYIYTIGSSKGQILKSGKLVVVQ